jgi:hypothetical protein
MPLRTILGISRSQLRGSLEMTGIIAEPFPRCEEQSDVAISAQERRRLLRIARNDINRRADTRSIAQE